MKPTVIALFLLLLAACASPRPGPDVVASAEQAVAAAEQAGGDEFAPTEMRFAREKLKSAKLGLENKKYEVALYLLEESEINSELAIEKSRAAKVRRQVNELRKSNEELLADMRSTFGDDFK